jgi:starch synthase (maltosyl-transferring)
MTRLILAATLGASYGIYGPAFEQCENTPREPGSEEYLNSEKYEVRQWNLDAPGGLGHLMSRLNQIRRENPALQGNRSLAFHAVNNEHLIAYSKHSTDLENLVLTVVNLDPRHTHSGWLQLPTAEWGLRAGTACQAHDLLTGERHLWSGTHAFVELNPSFVPAHIFQLRRHVRTEQDFDYFL